MLEQIFSSVFSTALTAGSFFISTAASLVLGFLLALSLNYKNYASKSFSITIALIPLIVQIIITLVNGNLGTGIAVAGAFSLVRFRSIPGSAKEILSVFMAMAVGLATGVGYIGVAVIFTMILIAMNFLYSKLNFVNSSKRYKELQITVPESLNYTEAFSDVFNIYLTDFQLQRVKTTNMGSLFKLTYYITFKQNANEREFLDLLRTRNSNLEISLCYQPTNAGEL